MENPRVAESETEFIDPPASPDKVFDGPVPLYSRMYGVLVAGAGFMCDAYDLFVINLVLVVMKILYTQSTASAASVSTAALFGAVFGQILFGLLADRIGRRKGFIITLALIVVGAFGSSTSRPIGQLNVFVILAFWRFLQGFGIGGEYPLSATISSETATDHTRRGRDIATVFSMQGIGVVLSPLVVLMLLRIFGENNLDHVWRFALGAGALPGVAMFYARCRMKETRQFTSRKHEKIPLRLILRKYWRQLIGTAGTWFIFDVTFYANGLFNATVVHMIGVGHQENYSQHQKLTSTVTMSLVLAFMALPGYFVAIVLIDRIGRRALMLFGFGALAVLYFSIGIMADQLVQYPGLFMVLYGLSFFFSNVGPNTVTFVLPSEVFPTQVRATCHGISAAAGKIGAVAGGVMMKPLFDDHGLGVTLMVCGLVAFVGMLLTGLLIEETSGKPLKEENFEEELRALSEEDLRPRVII